MAGKMTHEEVIAFCNRTLEVYGVKARVVMTTSWVVEFAECGEAAIREGTLDSVNYPDDLGCPVLRIRPLTEVKLKDIPWDKNGELRCEIIEP